VAVFYVQGFLQCTLSGEGRAACRLQVRASPVRLPEGAAFVVANSLAASHKAETAASRWAASIAALRVQ
jgi:hypothetical protein